MPKKSYAEKINSAQVMLSGLSGHLNELASRGINADFIAALKTATETAIAQNSVQEKLKADLKNSTASLNATLAKVDAAVSEAAKLVKLTLPKEQWLEFGIAAKR